MTDWAIPNIFYITLLDDIEKKEEKPKTPDKPKNKRKLSFKRFRRQESIKDENIEVK